VLQVVFSPIPYGRHTRSDIEIAETRGQQAATTAPQAKDELEQVAGNAEDEIGESIANIREKELLAFGEGSKSLLGVFGPILVQICGSPHKYKVAIITSAQWVLAHQALEPHAESSSVIIAEQVPLRQLGVLRRQSSSTLQNT
jgi:hypothetical protein